MSNGSFKVDCAACAGTGVEKETEEVPVQYEIEMGNVVFHRVAGNPPGRIEANFTSAQPLEKVVTFWRQEGHEVIYCGPLLDSDWDGTVALIILRHLMVVSNHQDGIERLLNDLIARAFEVGMRAPEELKLRSKSQDNPQDV